MSHKFLQVAVAASVLAFGSNAARCAWADQPPGAIADVVSHVQAGVVRIIVVHPEANQQATDPKLASANGEPMTSIGSGFVIDKKGFVATNRHVVENAMAIFVGTPDGGRYRASIVGMPNKADIALLRINPGADLPALTFGDSDQLRVGDTVIAIGSPFGFDNSVTAGIVSSVNRNIMESPFDDYIQTDAAINHGNSGGPLFNLQGQVVGMNSVLYAPGDYSGSAGVNFAIPANELRFVFDQLEKYGEVRAGMLPIRTQQVTGLIAQALGVPDTGGALVISLESQAERMNGAIQPGDIIRTFNGGPVLDPRDLARKAAMSPIGSTAHLQLYHQGKITTVDVPVLRFEQTSKPPEEQVRPHTVGIQFSPAPSGQHGVVISSIDRLGSAADSGLRLGDLIVQVQDQMATSPDQVTATINAREKSGASYFALLVERDKQRSWIPVGLPQ